ncbi:sensor histidine kinase [Nocardioides conyzicola]|uniref:sensor histidine kinase n=1 Tax=Nocardioides conyzicola TaxID=1651781 RepID=UPI0031EA22A5
MTATYASIMLTGAGAGAGARTWSQAATAASQFLIPAALASAVFLCVACRIYHRTGVAWFAAAMTMVGTQGFPVIVTPGTKGMSDPMLLWSAIALGAAMLLLVSIADAHQVTISPFPLGVGFGIALIVLREAEEALPGTLQLAAPAIRFGSAVLLLIGIVLAVAVWRQSCLPTSARRRLAPAVVLWSVAGVVGAMGLTDSAGWSVIAIVAALTTCVLVMSTSLDLLWQAVRDDHDAVVELQHQLRTLRDHAREGVEQLHEVKGTIAGIASATDLIRHEDRLTRQHREYLAEMLAQETARLQRLVHAGPRQSTQTVDLDQILRPLLMTHTVQGQQVKWEPCDLRVAADADELTEVLNILLHNAAEHAPGSPVRIFTRRDGGTVDLVVADAGPGIPEELRTRIFDWGYSQPGSSGQGVGLAMAHEVLARRGISLELDPEHAPGAAFVIRLSTVDQPGLPQEAALLAH